MKRMCVMFLIVSLLVVAVNAVELPLINGDFEDGPMYEDPPAGWGASNGIGKFDFPDGWDQPPNGSTYVCLFNNTASSQVINQLVASPIQTGYTYALDADLCNGRLDLDPHWTTCSMQLWARHPSGSPTELLFNDLTYYVDFTGVYEWQEIYGEYTSDGTYDGWNLYVQFQFLGGWQPWVDDVRLLEFIKAFAVTPDTATIFENALSGPASVACAVTLTSAPTQTVTVAGVSDADITVGGPVSFDGGDWNSTKYITVSSINLPDNTQVLNDHEVTFTTESDDPCFDNHIEVTIVTVVADDIAAVLVDPDDGVEVSEQGTTFDSYTVALLSLPTADVTIAPIVNDPCQITTTAPVTIAMATWYEPATITVTALEDDILEGDPHTDLISHLMMTDDPNYVLLVPDSVTVSIRDNECGAWSYSSKDYNFDCQINLIDLGIFTEEWLDCTDPHDPATCYDAR